MALVDQELDYPDNKYEGNLGVDDKTPELKWAVPGHSAVTELFNWLGRKTTTDLQRIREYLAEYESVRKLAPLTDMRQISGEEADIIYVQGYQPVFSFSDTNKVTVAATAQVKRPETRIMLYWSMPDVENTETQPTIDIDVDVSGRGQVPGENIDSSSQTLEIPDEDNEIQKDYFDLNLERGDINQDGWDDVRGEQMNIFISRSPKDFNSGRWQLHLVGVR